MDAYKCNEDNETALTFEAIKIPTKYVSVSWFYYWVKCQISPLPFQNSSNTFLQFRIKW
jgi:hypothetical protein